MHQSLTTAIHVRIIWVLHFGQSLWNEARSNYMTVCLTKILLTGKLYAMTYLNWNKITVMLICIPVFYPRCLSSAMQHWLVQLLEILWTWFHQTLRSLTGFVHVCYVVLNVIHDVLCDVHISFSLGRLVSFSTTWSLVL